MRLPGENETNGTPRYRLVPRRHSCEHRAEYPSSIFLKQRTEPALLGELGRIMQKVILGLWNDPPAEHLKRRAARRCVVPLSGVKDRGMQIVLAEGLLPESRSLHDILHLQPAGSPVLSLDQRHYAYRAIRAWRLPVVSDDTCVVYGAVSSALFRYYRREQPGLSNAKLMRVVRSRAVPAEMRGRCTRGDGGMLPTLPCHVGYHPVLLGEMRYLSLHSYLELFAILPTDPLAIFLIQQARGGDAGCRRSIRTLCQGFSGHSVSALLRTFERYPSPIAGEAEWLVATSFSGGCTFTSHLRRHGRPFKVVAAAECDPSHRLAHEANLPDLGLFARCVSDPRVIGGIPFHHLRVAGFPCNDYSSLRRDVSCSELLDGLRSFDLLIDSLRVFAPAVVLLENVPSLLRAGLSWVLRHIEKALGDLAGGRYLVFRDVVCCGGLGSRMVRPRVFWVLYVT